MPVAASDLTIIIPLAANENWGLSLIQDIRRQSSKVKIICVGPQCWPELKPYWLKSPQVGRGPQMNLAAQKASTKFLWFLHADSRLEPGALKKLLVNLTHYPNRLHYFDLVFLPDGPRLMWLNSLGVYFRSHYGQMPYGDQGLALARQEFFKVGGFTNPPYGEDHLFVWHWRQSGRKLQPVNEVIYTSARKYQQGGWLKTTCKHLWLGSRQAWPQYKILRQLQRPGKIAIFVKTPKYSPVKTRMAKDTSVEFAVGFHQVATRCTEKEVQDFCQQNPNCKAFWAVAEPQALKDWQGFEVIAQGNGSLGERLHCVYKSLISKSSWVVLIGADCPELTSNHLVQTKELLKKYDFVLGPSQDGGFYLFAGKKKIPQFVWTQVTYSQPRTRSELEEKLKKIGSIAHLEELSDVDTREDAMALWHRLKNQKKLSSSALMELQRHLSQLEASSNIVG